MALTVAGLAERLLPWRIAEARAAQPGPAEPKTRAMSPQMIPGRSGFVQGVPPTGFDEGAAAQQTAEAQNTDRATFLLDLWESYLKCPWAGSCVNAIARTVTAGGLVMVWDADTGEGDQTIPPKPPEVLAFENLIAFTNAKQDIRQLMRAVVADLMVFGDAFIEVVWLLGYPVALYNLDCPTTTPIADQHGNVQKYIQVTEYGQRAEFRPEQVIHITLDSARPAVFGISPTHMAEEAIVMWMYFAACAKKMAKRGLPPNIHADHPAGMGETDVTRWQDQYVVRNLGPDNVGTPIVTKGGGKVTELQTAKIADILAAMKTARDTIVSTYGTPPAKVGIIESGNLGGGTGSDQNKSWVLDIISPTAMLIAEKLQFHLAVQAFKIKGWHAEFAAIDYRDDQTIENIRDMRIRNGTWTVNRGRRDMGEPPVSGGDDAVIIARQDIVLVADLADRSRAGIEALGGAPLVGQPGKPGPSPAAGTGRPSGLGGAAGTPQPPSEETAEQVEAYLAELFGDEDGLNEHTAALTPAQRVWNQLSRDYPASALAWAKDAEWDPVAWIHPDQIDTSGLEDHAGPEVTRIRRRIRATGMAKPAVLVRAPGAQKDVIAAGHKHVLAAVREGHMVRAYVGHVTSDTGGWELLGRRSHHKEAALAGHNGQVH